MIKEIRLKPSVEENLSTGSLEVTVRLEEEPSENFFLWAVLTEEGGREADRIFPIQVQRQMQFCMQASDVILWDAEGVSLYDLILEIKDAEEQTAERTVKKIAFYRQQVTSEGLFINTKKVLPRPVHYQDSENFFSVCRKEFYNTVVVPDASYREHIKESCLEYGLYLLTQEEWDKACPEIAIKQDKMPAGGQKRNPDFELSVVQQGVLIENKCIFQNVSDYTVECTVRKKGEGQDCSVRSCRMEADIPPGTGCYMEYPFEPLEEAGKYRYCVRLLRKKDTAWAAREEPAAEEETEIMNFFGI